MFVFSNITMTDMRLGCFLAALLVYAFWGTPAPDAPGWPEAMVGLLLVLAVGWRQPAALLMGGAQHSFWQGSARMLLVYGLSVPLLIGLIHGNGAVYILRDVIPFLFMVMPLFLWPLVNRRPVYRSLITACAVIIGVVFALRVIAGPLISGGASSISALLAQAPVVDPFYHANAPTVLFAALLMIGLAGAVLVQRVSVSAHVKAGLMLVLAAGPLLAMALVSQRASLGYSVLALAALAGLALVREPRRALWPLIVAGLVAAFLWPVLAGLAQGLLEKTVIVGMNMRWQEARAVLDVLDGSALSVIFGKGWGATYVSPAAGGVNVNFTHNMLMGLWLKTELAGLGLAVLYLGALAGALWRLGWRAPLMAAALAGPFMIDVFLYASYKSLDFGLILLLIVLWAPAALHERAACSIEGDTRQAAAHNR